MCYIDVQSRNACVAIENNHADWQHPYSNHRHDRDRDIALVLILASASALLRVRESDSNFCLGPRADLAPDFCKISP